MADDATKRSSLADLEKRRALSGSRTRADAPVQAVDDAFWATAKVAMPPPGKTFVHLRVDADVLDWFRSQGRGHLTRMNAVLRSFVEAQKRGA
jgi:uncharacterized protein (DUF4415 family)